MAIDWTTALWELARRMGYFVMQHIVGGCVPADALALALALALSLSSGAMRALAGTLAVPRRICAGAACVARAGSRATVPSRTTVTTGRGDTVVSARMAR